MAIRTSSAKNDVFKDDVSCMLNKLRITDQLYVTKVTSGQFGGSKGLEQMHNMGNQPRNMKVYESFTLNYNVQWPLSLVISKKAINKY